MMTNQPIGMHRREFGPHVAHFSGNVGLFVEAIEPNYEDYDDYSALWDSAWLDAERWLEAHGWFVLGFHDGDDDGPREIGRLGDSWVLMLLREGMDERDIDPRELRELIDSIGVTGLAAA
ncbi:hypothetical protein [Phytoactinopolyspora halotolerans]|uniref:Uncharacterized protein n=1 Tax=Phytoactinopolyspora halotolerans TaxID=1981512 RepID=A0A6L9SL54_9ACTN|nr:hypothetical protein [Phytoactinopolyspora halotolerans]NEE04770.1 hypothetical protein [Phytoactinopolyspora halotolerans]